MSDKCIMKINCDNDDFVTGDVLTGTVEFRLVKAQKIREVVVYVSGEAQWIAKGEFSKANMFENIDNTVELFKAKFEHENDVDEFTAGDHSYDFSYKLPEEIPGSIQADRGNLNYTVDAFIHRPGKMYLHSTIPISVVSKEDLNLLPELKNPKKIKSKRGFKRFMFIKTKPLLITATIPQTGYVANQTIDVAIEVDNQSPKNVCKMTTSLIKTVSYYKINQYKESILKNVSTLAESFSNININTQETKSINQSLVIPKTIDPTNVHHSGIIQVSYELKVEAQMENYRKKIYFSIPIVIGTIPLAHSNNGHVNQSNNNNNNGDVDHVKSRM